MAPKKKGGDSKAEPAAGAAAGPAADAMVDGEADDDDEEVEQGNKRDGADVSKVTDFVEQKELDSAKASKALASITAADEVDRAAERERERELAAVVIDQVRRAHPPAHACTPHSRPDTRARSRREQGSDCERALPLQADVVMIATEMELDKDVAERTLREHKGDVVAALNTLVAA